ncbi:MAG TPA: hypothetical protein VFA77_15160 [Candidatus Eisenbacteria bacterium]|nr:hypothetical protein [Candidatus Eisenbacteria bacterium]
MENPQYELITGELLETLKGDCLDVIDFAAKNFRVNLAFSDESIVWLSSFIEDQRGKMDAQTRRSWGVRIGIYLGFAIIGRYGGDWVVRTDSHNPAVRFSTGALAFPLTKAQKQFENGIVDNIYGLYRNIERLLRREFVPGTSSS